jgi:hypothetical protein
MLAVRPHPALLQVWEEAPAAHIISALANMTRCCLVNLHLLLLQVWEEASAAHIIEAFTEALGPGDPSGLADMHLAALQQAQMAAISSAAGALLLRAPTPLGSGAVTPPPLLAGNSLGAAGGVSMAGLAGNSQLAGYPGSGSGAVAWGSGGSAEAAAAMAATVSGLGMIADGDPNAAAAAAAVAAAGSTGPMSVSGMGTTPSPVMGNVLPRGVSGGYDSKAESAPAGFVRMGELGLHCWLRCMCNRINSLAGAISQNAVAAAV